MVAGILTRAAADTCLSVLVAQQVQSTKGASQSPNKAGAVVLHHLAALDWSSAAHVGLSIGVTAGAVTAGAVATGAVAARSVTAGSIAAGSIAARSIVAGSGRVVVARRLTIPVVGGSGRVEGRRTGDCGGDSGKGDEDG